MTTQACIGSDLERAVSLLEQGHVVGIPTETVYGLAALCTQPQAIERVYQIKQRPRTHPLIMHAASWQALRPWLCEHLGFWEAAAKRLAECFWPGPLTLLLPASSRVLPQITAHQPCVAIRAPAHALAQALLQRLKVPIVAPSANPYGCISPTTSAHVATMLGEQIPYILEGGASVLGIESSIVGFEGDKAILYRTGAITASMLEEVLERRLHRPSPETAAITPGMQARHYAPHVPLYLGRIKDLILKHGAEQSGALCFSTPCADIPIGLQRILSPAGRVEEAAARLFAALHELDKMPIARIFAEPMPAQGVGIAIQDRLHRAALSEELP